ncbi:MAG: putative Ig domain-containing protein, partial [Pseudomonadota bacterium]
PYSLAQTYSLLVSPPPPPIANPATLTLPANSPGAPVATTLGGGTATGVAVAVTPSHGTVNVAGLTMTYVPDAGYSGADSFAYTAFNITGHSAEATVSVTVTPPTLTLSALPATGQVTVPYSGTATASLGAAPYSVVRTAGALPTGVTLAASGALSGAPTAAGTFTFTLEATDANGATGARSYTVTVDAPTVAITSPAAGALPGVDAGVAYSRAFTATGGQGAHSFSITAGALPPGLTLSAAGILSGTPTTAGAFNFSVTPRDSSGAPGPYAGAPSAYSLTVAAPTVTVGPSTLAAAATATAYSATIVASGGAGPDDYAVTAGALPAGLSLSNGGVLSGTLAASGTFNFVVAATDSFGFSGARAFSVTVTDPVIAVTAPAAGALTQGVVGTAYSRTFTASGGQGAHSFVLVGGALPPGLTLSTGGVLSGAPTALGAFSFSIRASDGSPAPGPFSSPAANYTLQIAAPTVTLAPAAGPLPDGQIATPYSQAFSASGSAAPYGFAVTAGALPAGLTLSADGTLSGTPTGTGTFNFTLAATDSSPGPAGPFSASRAYSVTIQPPTLALDPSAGGLPAATAAVAYGQTFTAGGGTAPYSYAVTAGALPAGLTLSAGGVLSGAPPVEGVFNFTVTASDSTTGVGAPYVISQPYALTVGPPVPPVAGPATLSLPANSAGQAVTLDLSGGMATSVAVATPPAHGTTSIAGLTITYSPTAGFSGSDSFTYTATNSGGTSAPATVSVTVMAPTLTLSAAPTTGEVTVPYSATVAATMGAAPYLFEAAAGSLPPGLTLAADGVLSGAPTAAGVFTFTLKATDAHGATGTRVYSLTIDAPGIAITTPAAGALPAGVAGTAYAATFSATGGQGGHSFSITAGALPPGMTLSAAGGLSGTPTVAGTFNVVVTPADLSAAPGPYAGTPESYSLTIAAPAIAVNPGAIPPAVTAAPYSVSITASGGVGAYGYAVTAGALPPGLSLSGAGALAGSPTASGTFTFTITATDSLGFSGARLFSMTVSSPVITVTAPAAGALPAALGGTAYSQAFTATGGQGAHTFALASGTLPAGLTLSTAGVLSGTPSAAGAFSFSILATDASPAPGPFASVAVTYTLEVAAPTQTMTPAAGALPDGLITAPYSQAFSASGGAAPYTFAVSAGALPDGLILSGAGVLAGTPAVAGSYGVSVTATDANGFALTQAYTLEIGTPVPVVTAKTAAVTVGQSVIIDVTEGAVGVGITSIAVASPPRTARPWLRA